MKNRLTAMAAGLLLCTGATAQRTLVVVDAETGTPLRNVALYTDGGQTDTTRWNGTVAVPDSAFTTLCLAHVKYETRHMTPEEVAMADTVGLLPRYNALAEVIVWGHRPRLSEQPALQLSKTELQLQRPVPQGFNPLGLLAFVYNKLFSSGNHLSKAERRELKYKQMMDEY